MQHPLACAGLAAAIREVALPTDQGQLITRPWQLWMGEDSKEKGRLGVGRKLKVVVFLGVGKKQKRFPNILTMVFGLRDFRKFGLVLWFEMMIYNDLGIFVMGV